MKSITTNHSETVPGSSPIVLEGRHQVTSLMFLVLYIAFELLDFLYFIPFLFDFRLIFLLLYLELSLFLSAFLLLK